MSWHAGADVELREFRRTDHSVELTVADRAYLDQLADRAATRAADHGGLDKPPLSAVPVGGERYHLKAAHYVGVLGLPSGLRVAIEPKAGRTNFGYVLRYGHRVNPLVEDGQTKLGAGETFLDALAALYCAELDPVLRRGLDRGYRRVDENRARQRGRLDLRRQLQREGPVPTGFECSFERLTEDTLLNRTVLYAATVLRRNVRSRSIEADLRRQEQLLRRHVTPTTVRPGDLERITLTRLNRRYEAILELAGLVIRGVYAGDRNPRPTASFVLNMNQTFEGVVERALEAAFAGREGWRVAPQEDLRTLTNGGDFLLRPDAVVYDADGEIRLVCDAKWKPLYGTPRRDDLYQLVAYQAATDAPALLCYPQLGRMGRTVHDVRNLGPLRVLQVPTDADADGYQAFVREVERTVADAVNELLE